MLRGLEVDGAGLTGNPNAAVDGKALAAVGREEEARDRFERLIEEDPTSYEAIENIGNELLNAQNWKGAAIFLEMAAEARSKIGAEDFTLYYNIGVAYYSMKDEDPEAIDKSIMYYEQALNIQPVVMHVIEADRDLAGFITFGSDAQVPGGDYTRPATDIGLGIRPDLTGRGRGGRFVAAVVDFARMTFGAAPLRVTIATGNVRARKVWSGSGFTETQRFQSAEMVLGSNEFAVLETD